MNEKSRERGEKRRKEERWKGVYLKHKRKKVAGEGT